MQSPPDNNWTVADLIDFELLVREEVRAADASERKERNREIFLEIQQDLGSATPDQSPSTSRRQLFLGWLRRRRQGLSGKGESIGQALHSEFQFLGAVMGVAGAVIAAVMVQGIFAEARVRPGEAAPVNAIRFAAASIGVPFLLTLYGFYVLISGQIRMPVPRLPMLLIAFYHRILGPFLRKLIERTLESSSAEKRLQASAVAGDVRAMIMSRKGLAAGYFAVWIQALGLGYAIALPAAILWKNATTSRDFGWETNLGDSISPDRLHRAVEWTATPWAWWKGEGAGYPSLDQVRDTQHKQYAPASADTAKAWEVWGTFLLLASIAYVAAPRIALYGLSLSSFKRRLARERFDEARFDDLDNDLLIPTTSWGISDCSPTPANRFPEGEVSDYSKDMASVGRPFVLAISEDLISAALEESIAEFFATTKNWKHRKTIAVPETSEDQEAFFNALAQQVGVDPAIRVVVVEDSVAPPSGQRISFLQDVRARLGPRPGIIVALLGEGSDEALGNAPRSSDFDVWSGKVRAIGDPDIRVVSFRSPVA